MTKTYSTADYPPGLVAVPCQDWMWTESSNSFMALTQGIPPGSSICFGRQSSSPASNRNHMTRTFLAEKTWKWILFIDSDMVVPRETVVRLLSHNVDCISATYFGRQEPFIPAFAALPTRDATRNSNPEIQRVQWVGAGCLLVRRNVIEKIRDPWWEHPNPGDGEDNPVLRQGQLSRCSCLPRHGIRGRPHDYSRN